MPNQAGCQWGQCITDHKAHHDAELQGSGWVNRLQKVHVAWALVGITGCGSWPGWSWPSLVDGARDVWMQSLARVMNGDRGFSRATTVRRLGYMYCLLQYYMRSVHPLPFKGGNARCGLSIMHQFGAVRSCWLRGRGVLTWLLLWQ